MNLYINHLFVFIFYSCPFRGFYFVFDGSSSAAFELTQIFARFKMFSNFQKLNSFQLNEVSLSRCFDSLVFQSVSQ